jgi:Fe-S cluster assembly ATPase SufC
MALDSTILEIKDLQVSINENEILKNLNLKLIGAKFMQ